MIEELEDDYEMGGEHWAVAPGSSRDEIPSSARSMVTDDIWAAFLNPAGYFSNLASHCESPAMTAYLESVAECEDYFLELHTEYAGSVYLRFELPSASPGFGILAQDQLFRLDNLPAELPESFRRFYSLLGCLQHDDFGVGGNWWSLDGVKPFSQLMQDWELPKDYIHPDVDPDSCYPFHDTHNGDLYAVHTDGDIYIMDHEIGYEAASRGRAADWIESYFEQLNDGVMIAKILEPYR